MFNEAEERVSVTRRDRLHGVTTLAFDLERAFDKKTFKEQCLAGFAAVLGGARSHNWFL